jgi:predicted nuclease of predicted toxin-antitoxin system
VRLWFDEDLSPTRNAQGFEATCNRDRGLLGSSDARLRSAVQAEGYVLVTDNASDFRGMYARAEIHHGLMLLPGRVGRARQQALLRAALACLRQRAAAAGEPPADVMVNALLTVEDDGRCRLEALPEP